MSRRRRPSAIADRTLDHDRRVALEQLPRHLQPAFAALWNLDLAFADVVSTSSDPRLGAIRLAWWRERLEELDQANAVPAEPRLQVVASELLRRAISGTDLSQLEDAWLPLLDPFPWGVSQIEGMKLRGRILFSVGARLLGGEPAFAEPAGELWALMDAVRHCSDPQSREVLLQGARSVLVEHRVPTNLRPMTIIAAVAVANLRDPGSAVARGMAAIRHRLTGRVPQL